MLIIIRIISFPESPSRWRHAKVPEPSPKIVFVVSKRYERGIGYHTYRLIDNSSEYNGKVAQNTAKGAKRLQTQIQSRTLDEVDPISVISFLSAFKMARDTNEIQESAAKAAVHFFMEGSSAAALNARLRLEPTSSSSTPKTKEGMLSSYSEVIKVLLQTYATDDFISETDAALMQYNQLPALLHTQDVRALVTRSLS